MKHFIGRVYIAGYDQDDNPMIGHVELFLGETTYLCRHEQGVLSNSMMSTIDQMREWRFFNNMAELQAFLRARDTLKQNAAARQKRVEKNTPVKKPARGVTNTPKKATKGSRRKSPARKNDPSDGLE